MIALEPLIAAFWLKGRGFTTASTVAVSCNKFPGGAQRKRPPPKISVVLKKGRMAPFMKMANLFALQKKLSTTHAQTLHVISFQRGETVLVQLD